MPYRLTANPFAKLPHLRELCVKAFPAPNAKTRHPQAARPRNTKLIYRPKCPAFFSAKLAHFSGKSSPA
jgi:hypothetical protein